MIEGRGVVLGLWRARLRKKKRRKKNHRVQLTGEENE